MVRTEDIVNRFISTYFEQKGLSYKPADEAANSEVNGFDSRNDYEAELDEICRALNDVSMELQEFVRQTNSDRFKALTSRLLTNFSYDSFKTVMDELFIKGIRWNHVVTFFVYAAESACGVAEGKSGGSKSNNNRRALTQKEQAKIARIIIWMCTYIDDNLIQWIESQKGGWLSIKNPHQQPVWMSVIKNGSVWPLAVFAVFIGGLYISKMSP